MQPRLKLEFLIVFAASNNLRITGGVHCPSMDNKNKIKRDNTPDTLQPK